MKRAERRAGKSVISTSLDGLDPLVVDDLYRLHFEVEAAFRTLKSDLELRPIRHRRANRIRAHVLVAVMAYNVVRHLQRRTGRTIGAIGMLRDILASVSVQRVQLGAASFWQSVDLTEEQLAAFERLDYDPPLPRFEAHLVDRAEDDSQCPTSLTERCEPRHKSRQSARGGAPSRLEATQVSLSPARRAAGRTLRPQLTTAPAQRVLSPTSRGDQPHVAL